MYDRNEPPPDYPPPPPDGAAGGSDHYPPFPGGDGQWIYPERPPRPNFQKAHQAPQRYGIGAWTVVKIILITPILAAVGALISLPISLLASFTIYPLIAYGFGFRSLDFEVFLMWMLKIGAGVGAVVFWHHIISDEF